MPSDKHNSTTIKAMGLIFALFGILCPEMYLFEHSVFSVMTGLIVAVLHL